MSISFVIPTLGRPSLVDAVASVELRPEDQFVIVQHQPPGEHWGSEERIEGMARATCTHIAFLDDDDVYLPGHRAAMQAAIDEAPDRPHLFRMVYPSGRVLWDEPVFRPGNVGSPMILIPNEPSKFGSWLPRRTGDFDFLNDMAWRARQIMFHDVVIAQVSHEDERWLRKNGAVAVAD